MLTYSLTMLIYYFNCFDTPDYVYSYGIITMYQLLLLLLLLSLLWILPLLLFILSYYLYDYYYLYTVLP